MDVIECLKERKETVWLNPDLWHCEPRCQVGEYKFVHVKAAQNRFMRFLPYIASAFPETAAKKGVIESGLIPIPAVKERMNAEGAGVAGTVFLKDDARLPIAGSVKARGGIHEVLKIAETLAQKAGSSGRQITTVKLIRRNFGTFTVSTLFRWDPREILGSVSDEWRRSWDLRQLCTCRVTQSSGRKTCCEVKV